MRADEPERAGRIDRADRPGPKRAPGPVTGEFGRIGWYRRMPMTGPSNWRKATWLIVAMASVVLVVLVFGAVRLTGPYGRSEHVDAFPGLPTGGLLTPQPRHTLVLPETKSDDAGQGMSEQQTQPGTGTQTSRDTTTGDRPDDQAPGVDGSGPTGTPPPSSGSAAPSPSPNGDLNDIVDATERFFGLLPEDVDAAWLMMDAADQPQDFAQFNRSWRRYQEVELQDVPVGTGETTVVASIRVTDHKGISATQQWELTFRRGGELVIDKLVLLDSGPSVSHPSGNTP